MQIRTNSSEIESIDSPLWTRLGYEKYLQRHTTYTKGTLWTAISPSGDRLEKWKTLRMGGKGVVIVSNNNETRRINIHERKWNGIETASLCSRNYLVLVSESSKLDDFSSGKRFLLRFLPQPFIIRYPYGPTRFFTPAKNQSWLYRGIDVSFFFFFFFFNWSSIGLRVDAKLRN